MQFTYIGHQQGITLSGTGAVSQGRSGWAGTHAHLLAGPQLARLPDGGRGDRQISEVGQPGPGRGAGRVHELHELGALHEGVPLGQLHAGYHMVLRPSVMINHAEGVPLGQLHAATTWGCGRFALAARGHATPHLTALTFPLRGSGRLTCYTLQSQADIQP